MANSQAYPNSNKLFYIVLNWVFVNPSGSWKILGRPWFTPPFIHRALKISGECLKYMPYTKDINTTFTEVSEMTVRQSSCHCTAPEAKSILFSISQNVPDDFNLQIKIHQLWIEALLELIFLH